MDWNAVVGRNVLRERQRLGLSQDQLAEEAGITGRYLGRIERGQANVSVAVMGRIAAVLRASPTDLLRV